MRGIFNKAAVMTGLVSLLAGCATQTPYDYTAYRQAMPRSVLVLPPLNESPDVNATLSVLAHTTQPLAEAGYYVMPVALMHETFVQNGLSNAPDIHAVSTSKLQEIFGADAALYITVSQYGSTYTILSSAAVVTAKGKLLDLKTGRVLWSGSASASSEEGNSGNQGGLAGMLVAAIVKQILNNVTDMSHTIAGKTTGRLLGAGMNNGLLYGPRSPMFGKDGQPR